MSRKCSRYVGFKIFVSLLAVFTLAIANAQSEPEEVVWYADLPEDGYNHELDIMDIEAEQIQLLKTLVKSDLTFNVINTPIIAGLEKIAQGEDACVSNVIHTPKRAAFAYFSAAYSVFLSHQIVYIEGNENAVEFADRVTTDGHFDLEYAAQLVSMPNIGVAESRAYASPLNDMLESIQSRLIFVHGDNNVASLLQALLNGDISYAIEYPDVAVKYAAKHAPNKRIALIPIDGVKSFVVGRIACSRTKKGRRVIKHLNQALRSLGTNPNYLNILRKPYHGQLKRHYTRAYNEVFGTEF
ncbi:transporter substrate-binding domain-containing protein [Aestuariibacter sp. AA17]|uniref:Transporter substrate-binding domain-containing protein n=1 Tax=Fluctibacter corallii TaxID=2984329 RepID=A0ABT3AB24_9ALTE|nr:transporter substrate-binding domain-containing protein [Aestuariibacter sp. AA17]MCV2885876.1 transporter substrate-binding domain-containing protein [Aestuariibacter sp. AA17]